MNSNSEIRNIVLEQAKATFNNVEIDENTDFFSAGISSLAVVKLQMAVEEALERTVETSELMINSTLNGWVELYQSANA